METSIKSLENKMLELFPSRHLVQDKRACFVLSNLLPRLVVADDAEDGPAIHVLRPVMRTLPYDLRSRRGKYTSKANIALMKLGIGGCVN